MKHITITQSGTYEYSLAKAGEEIEIRGRLKIKNEEKLSIHLTVIHKAKHTKSHISIKTTVSDQARASIIGNIIVEEGAGKSESFLEEKVLLLSSKASAEAIPNLEIKTNDIKCSHAATVSTFDEEQLFYLSTRGIPLNQSKDLLITSFLS